MRQPFSGQTSGHVSGQQHLWWNEQAPMSLMKFWCQKVTPDMQIHEKIWTAFYRPPFPPRPLYPHSLYFLVPLVWYDDPLWHLRLASVAVSAQKSRKEVVALACAIFEHSMWPRGVGPWTSNIKFCTCWGTKLMTCSPYFCRAWVSLYWGFLHILTLFLKIDVT